MWRSEDAPVPLLDNVSPIEHLSNAIALSSLEAARNALRAVAKGYRRKLHDGIAEAYRFARQAADDPELGRALYDHKFFNGRKRNVNRLLQDAMCFLLGARKGPGYDRAYTYRVGLEPFFNRKAPVHEVREALKERGSERLYRDAVKARREMKASSKKPKVSPGASKSEKRPPREQSGTSRIDKAKLGIARRILSNLKDRRPQVLHVEMSDELLSEVLEADVGQVRYLKIRSTEIQDDLVRIIATFVKS
jgi:hypothetical protein